MNARRKKEDKPRRQRKRFTLGSEPWNGFRTRMIPAKGKKFAVPEYVRRDSNDTGWLVGFPSTKLQFFSDLQLGGSAPALDAAKAFLLTLTDNDPTRKSRRHKNFLMQLGVQMVTARISLHRSKNQDVGYPYLYFLVRVPNSKIRNGLNIYVGNVDTLNTDVIKRRFLSAYGMALAVQQMVRGGDEAGIRAIARSRLAKENPEFIARAKRTKLCKEMDYERMMKLARTAATLAVEGRRKELRK